MNRYTYAEAASQALEQHIMKQTLTANAIQHGGTHYKDKAVQPWDVVDTWPLEQRIGFYRGNAQKYIMRLGDKDERLLEAKKAQHYIQKLIEVLEAEASKGTK